MFSTSSPPAIQRVPWPDVGEGDGNARGGYDTWVINEEELPWLVDADGTPISAWSPSYNLNLLAAVTVCQISYHRQTGFETWITSDGRAYLVQFFEEEDIQPSASEASVDDEQRSPVRWYDWLLQCCGVSHRVSLRWDISLTVDKPPMARTRCGPCSGTELAYIM